MSNLCNIVKSEDTFPYKIIIFYLPHVGLSKIKNMFENSIKVKMVSSVSSITDEVLRDNHIIFSKTTTTPAYAIRQGGRLPCIKFVQLTLDKLNYVGMLRMKKSNALLDGGLIYDKFDSECKGVTQYFLRCEHLSELHKNILSILATGKTIKPFFMEEPLFRIKVDKATKELRDEVTLQVIERARQKRILLLAKIAKEKRKSEELLERFQKAKLNIEEDLKESMMSARTELLNHKRTQIMKEIVKLIPMNELEVEDKKKD